MAPGTFGLSDELSSPFVTICLGPSGPVPEPPLCVEPGATSWPPQTCIWDPVTWSKLI